MELIKLISAAQSFFWVLLLLQKSRKQLPDFLLATWIFVIGINLSLAYVISFDPPVPHYPKLIGVNAGIPALHGAFLLLYVLAHEGKIRQITWKQGVHLIPITVIYVLYLPQFLMSSKEIDLWMQQTMVNPPWNVMLNDAIGSFTGLFYTLWTWRELSRHRLQVQQFYSDTKGRTLQWLKSLVFGMLFIWIVVITSYAIGYHPGNASKGMFATLMKIDPAYLAASVFVFFVGFFGIRQGTVFSDATLSNALMPIELNGDETLKYKRSGLSEEAASELKGQLEAVIESKKLFLRPDLTLADLAEHVHSAPNHVSQVINAQFGVNFYEFVNRHRLEAFKRGVLADKNRTKSILGHAMDAGFSSKSTFNEYFKKVEQRTPSNWLKDQPKQDLT